MVTCTFIVLSDFATIRPIDAWTVNGVFCQPKREFNRAHSTRNDILSNRHAISAQDTMHAERSRISTLKWFLFSLLNLDWYRRPWRKLTLPHTYIALLTSPATKPNLSMIAVPTAPAPKMIAMEIKAPIRPYSMAVAPDWSAANFKSNFFMIRSFAPEIAFLRPLPVSSSNSYQKLVP